jgi:hypothetical protein
MSLAACSPDKVSRQETHKICSPAANPQAKTRKTFKISLNATQKEEILARLAEFSSTYPELAAAIREDIFEKPNTWVPDPDFFSKYIDALLPFGLQEDIDNKGEIVNEDGDVVREWELFFLIFSINGISKDYRKYLIYSDKWMTARHLLVIAVLIGDQHENYGEIVTRLSKIMN